ncbi:MAG: TIGR04255 family protein [Dermatophilaceae bacterium]
MASRVPTGGAATRASAHAVPRCGYRRHLHPGRLWFESGDRARLIQLQADRLTFNWRRTDEVQVYPRYPAVRDAYAQAWQTLESALGKEAPQLAQIEVTYVNTESLPPNEVLLGWDNPLCRQQDGHFTANFDEPTRLESATQARRQTAVAGVYGERPETQWTLTVRAQPADMSDPMSAIDAARAAVVTRFKDITSPEMHERWGELS